MSGFSRGESQQERTSIFFSQHIELGCLDCGAPVGDPRGDDHVPTLEFRRRTHGPANDLPQRGSRARVHAGFLVLRRLQGPGRDRILLGQAARGWQTHGLRLADQTFN